MVSPLGQRQMFLTAHVQDSKAAVEVSAQVQREAGQKQALADRMAEDQVSVLEIPHTDAMRAEERHGGRQGQGEWAEEKEEGGEDQPEGEGSATDADSHMDFLA